MLIPGPIRTSALARPPRKQSKGWPLYFRKQPRADCGGGCPVPLTIEERPHSFPAPSHPRPPRCLERPDSGQGVRRLRTTVGPALSSSGTHRAQHPRVSGCLSRLLSGGCFCVWRKQLYPEIKALLHVRIVLPTAFFAATF